MATAQQVKGLANPTDTALFAGQTIDGTTVLVKSTYGGDANLDGKVDVSDYGRIDNSITQGKKGWANGDFNYDGKITISDYGIIDFNVGTQGPPIQGRTVSSFTTALPPILTPPSVQITPDDSTDLVELVGL